MRLSGYQPHYFPRLHYIQRALDSDVFEISDYLQFVKKHDFVHSDGTHKRGKSYQAHSVIKLQSGAHFLVVPTRGGELPITQTPIDYTQNWVHTHLETFKTAFGKSPNFKQFYPEIETLVKQNYSSLGDLTIKTVLWSLYRVLTDQPLSVPLTTSSVASILKTTKHPFKLKTVVLASETPVPPPGESGPNPWLIALCKQFHAGEYLTGGTGHTAYMDESVFTSEKIKILVQDWHCPEYTQQYRQVGFLSNLSAIDLIMNESLVKRQEILS